MFDLVIGRPVRGERLVASLARLRQNGVGAAPRVADRRGWFQPVGIVR